jgi:hypothetical protein
VDADADVDELADELATLQQVPQPAVGRALGARLERLNRCVLHHSPRPGRVGLPLALR